MNKERFWLHIPKYSVTKSQVLSTHSQLMVAKSQLLVTKPQVCKLMVTHSQLCGYKNPSWLQKHNYDSII